MTSKLVIIQSETMIPGLSIVIPMIIAFLGSYFFAPWFIRMLELEGIVGYDQMKVGKPRVAEMGAPVILAGFFMGIFAFIGGQSFLTHFIGVNEIAQLLAVMATIMIMTFIGMMDELTCLIKKSEGIGIFEEFKRIGLSTRVQMLLPFFAAVPLMAVNVGVSTLNIPFFGQVNIGLLYPLVLVPLAIVGTSNATNILAGFNGMQAGIGIVMMFFLGSYAYLNGGYVAAVLAFIFLASLIAFLRYNWYPARIFPGGLDYIVGTMIGVVAILGNIEKFALLCFAPWFIELGLKIMSRLKAENFGILQEDGTLKPREKKIRSWLHIIMRLGRFNEWQVSLIMIGIIFTWCAIVSIGFYVL